MFECFLARLSVSEYSEKFVVKGGMLIAAIVGLDTRSTMDLDTTLRNLPLTEEKISDAINTICEIDMKDDVVFTVKSIEPIRKDDIYGGYCVRLDAVYDTIITPLSIDVSTGDVITPNAVKYEFSGIFDGDIRISLWGYNIETVIAEKVETILRRGVFSTRPRDYYDVYILGTTQEYDKEIYKEALKATAEHRGRFFRHPPKAERSWRFFSCCPSGLSAGLCRISAAADRSGWRDWGYRYFPHQSTICRRQRIHICRENRY